MSTTNRVQFLVVSIGAAVRTLKRADMLPQLPRKYPSRTLFSLDWRQGLFGSLTLFFCLSSRFRLAQLTSQLQRCRLRSREIDTAHE
eukprot:COSAG01_NODE_1557_length_9928_cov_7.869977_9_plen_87_part_00